MKVVLLAPSLHRGGAERQLVLLARGLRARGDEPVVMLFYSGGGLEADLGADVPVVHLRKAGRWDSVGFLVRLVRALARHRPDVLIPYLTTPCIVGALAGRALRIPVVWSTHASGMELTHYDWLVRITDRIAAWLSRTADVVVCSSEEGRRHHLRVGYPVDRTVTVACGIDTDRFAPDAGRAGAAAGERPVVGMVARLDPIKDHTTFLEAVALYRQSSQEADFVCVGAGDTPYGATVRALSHDLGLDDAVTWVGERPDMPAVYAGMTINTISSSSEGLPNAVLESMSMGVPCVVTHVGDLPDVVGDLGVVVEPGDAQALAQGWDHLLDRLAAEGPSLRRSCRERVIERYSSDAMVSGTRRAAERAIERRRGRRPRRWRNA